MLRAPLKAGERPRATPVMIPTHTSKAPAAAVERSFKSWFTGPDLLSEMAAQGITRANRQAANPSIHRSAWKGYSANFALTEY
jgi:hypothetical protein